MANVVDVHLKLVTTERDIATKINDTIRNHIQKIFLTINTFDIKKKIGKTISHAILNSQEVKSLHGGQLQGELGVVSPKVTDAVNLIIDSLISTMVVTMNPLRGTVAQRLKGSITLEVLPKTLITHLANTKEGAFLTKKGVHIPWLKWLLTLGDKIILRQFDVDFGNTVNSRTGLAVMKSSKRGWRVPPQYSGTITNNFISRAIDDSSTEIIDLFIKEFQKKI